MSAALSLFLQQLAATTSVVLTVLTIARRREIATFCSTHYAKVKTIQRLENENSQLRNSLSATNLALEGYREASTEMNERIDRLVAEQKKDRETLGDLSKGFDTLTQKFVSGISYIATELAHGDMSRLPALIRDDIEVEIQRQSRSPR